MKTVTTDVQKVAILFLKVIWEASVCGVRRFVFIKHRHVKDKLVNTSHALAVSTYSFIHN